MERRVLAELFVEDDRAIEEDLGTIDYVEREAGWMSESGISIGQMRILDDDDPEDAKASDLADKIFNSKENENKIDFVYVLKTAYAYNGNADTEIAIFSTFEEAKRHFDAYVDAEKANDHLMEFDDKVIEESEDRFAIWQDGRYCEDHYEITIEEKVVH